MPDYNKVFAMYLVGPGPESDIAYQILCDAGIRTADVAKNVGGDNWVSNWGGYEFSEPCESDTPGCAS